MIELTTESFSAVVDRDPSLAHRGRFVRTTFLLGVGGEDHLIEVLDGRVTQVAAGPLVMPRWTFALRAPASEWEAFWRPVPPPGSNDLFALRRRGVLQIEGDLHPFMANLRYFKELLGGLRPSGGSK